MIHSWASVVTLKCVIMQHSCKINANSMWGFTTCLNKKYFSELKNKSFDYCRYIAGDLPIDLKMDGQGSDSRVKNGRCRSWMFITNMNKGWQETRRPYTLKNPSLISFKKQSGRSFYVGVMNRYLASSKLGGHQDRWPRIFLTSIFFWCKK